MYICFFSRVYRIVTLLLSLSAVTYVQPPKRFSRDLCRCDSSRTGQSFIHLSLSPLFSPYQSRAIILSRSDIYMAIAGATPLDGVCAPRPELKPPHYHGGPWRAGVGPGGCALDEAAAGESVLRILEVMSRAVLYNTRSRPFQSRPLSASSYRPPSRSACRRSTSTPALRGSWWKMEIANPSVFPSTSFIFKRLKNFFLERCRCTSGS